MASRFTSAMRRKPREPVQSVRRGTPRSPVDAAERLAGIAYKLGLRFDAGGKPRFEKQPMREIQQGSHLAKVGDRPAQLVPDQDYPQALDDGERQYLAEAIGRILAGIDPKRALCLIERAGRPSHPMNTRNVEIYNYVQERRALGVLKAHTMAAAHFGRKDIQEFVKLRRKAGRSPSEAHIDAAHRFTTTEAKPLTEADIKAICARPIPSIKTIEAICGAVEKYLKLSQTASSKRLK